MNKTSQFSTTHRHTNWICTCWRMLAWRYCLCFPVMFLKSRKRMDKTTAVHNTQLSEILAAVFQAAFTGATRYDGMARYQWAFRTKAAAMWLNTSKNHQQEINSDSLHTRFRTNFWPLHFRNVTLFQTPTFAHSIPYEVRTCDLRKGGRREHLPEEWTGDQRKGRGTFK